MTVAWRVSLPETAEGPLATDGERIFVATRDGSVHALDRLTGAVVWQTRKQPGWLGYGSGLLALREADGTVWGLDPQTGSARWKAQSGVAGDLPPVIYKDAVLVAGQGLASLRIDSGGILWSIPEPRLTVPPVPSGPWILVGEAGGTVRNRDSATGRSLWAFPTAQPLRAEPAVDDRQSVLLGTTDRRFVALGIEKGGERWTWKVGADVAAPRRRYWPTRSSSPATKTSSTPSTAATATWPGAPPCPPAHSPGRCCTAPASSSPATAPCRGRRSSSASTRDDRPAAGRPQVPRGDRLASPAGGRPGLPGPAGEGGGRAGPRHRRPHAAPHAPARSLPGGFAVGRGPRARRGGARILDNPRGRCKTAFLAATPSTLT